MLKSWAVPKGIPLERGNRHLAVELEDHPREYVDFEGIIPECQYGAGTLVQMRRGGSGEDSHDRQWLLIKSDANARAISKKRDDESARDVTREQPA